MSRDFYGACEDCPNTRRADAIDRDNTAMILEIETLQETLRDTQAEFSRHMEQWNEMRELLTQVVEVDGRTEPQGWLVRTRTLLASLNSGSQVKVMATSLDLAIPGCCGAHKKFSEHCAECRYVVALEAVVDAARKRYHFHDGTLHLFNMWPNPECSLCQAISFALAIVNSGSLEERDG